MRCGGVILTKNLKLLFKVPKATKNCEKQGKMSQSFKAFVRQQNILYISPAASATP